MKNFIRENWFKFFLLLAIIVYVLSFAYEQYRLTVSYNAEKLQWCTIHVDQFKGDSGNDKLSNCLDKHYSKYHLPFSGSY